MKKNQTSDEKLTTNKIQKGDQKKLNQILLKSLIIWTFLSSIKSQICKAGSINNPITTIGDNTGSGSHEILVSDIGLDSSTEFTISLWVKLNSHIADSTIFYVGAKFRLYFFYVDLIVAQFYSVQFAGGGGIQPIGFFLMGNSKVELAKWHNLIMSVKRIDPTSSKASFYPHDNTLTEFVYALGVKTQTFLYNWDLAPTDKINFGNYVNAEAFKSIDGTVGNGIIIPKWVGDDPYGFAIHAYKKPFLRDLWLLNFYADHTFTYNIGNPGSQKILTKSKGVPLNSGQFPEEDLTHKVYKFTAGKLMSAEKIAIPPAADDYSNSKSFYLKIKINSLPTTGVFTLLKFEHDRSFEIRITSAGKYELWTGTTKIFAFSLITITTSLDFKQLIISYSYSNEIGGKKYISLNYNGVFEGKEATGVLAPGPNNVDEYNFEIGNELIDWKGMEFSVAEFSIWTGSFQLVSNCAGCDQSAGYFYNEKKHCLKCLSGDKRLFGSGSLNMEMSCSATITPGYYQVYSDPSSASYSASKCTENPNFQKITTPTPALTPPDLCTNCHSDCLTCSGASENECISCYTAANRHLQGSTCPLCPLTNGFYMNYGSGLCLSCSTGCKSCSAGGMNKCLSCDTASGYYFCSGCSSAGPGEGTCVQCPASTFWNGASCQGCHTSCKFCTGVNSNQCTLCDATAMMYFCAGCSGAISGEGTCILCDNTPNSAGPGLSQYWSGTTCETCDPSCRTCGGPGVTNCLSCDLTAKKYLETGTGKCLLCDDINNQVYWNSPNCGNCDVSCDHCTGLTNGNCVQCNNADKYFLSGGKCLKCETNTAGSNQYWDNLIQNCGSCSVDCVSKKCTGPSNQECEGFSNENSGEIIGGDLEDFSNNNVLTWKLKMSDVWDNRVLIEFNRNVNISTAYNNQEEKLKELFELDIENINSLSLTYKVYQTEKIYIDFDVRESYEKTVLSVKITNTSAITSRTVENKILNIKENQKKTDIPAYVNFEKENSSTKEVIVGSTSKIALGSLLVAGVIVTSTSCCMVSLGFLLKMVQTIEFISLFLFFNVRYSNFLTTYLQLIYKIMNIQFWVNPLTFLEKPNKFSYAYYFKGKLTKEKVEPFLIQAGGFEFVILVIFWIMKISTNPFYLRKKYTRNKENKILLSEESFIGDKNLQVKGKNLYFNSYLDRIKKKRVKQVKENNDRKTRRIIAAINLMWINFLLLFYVDYIFISGVNALHFKSILKQSLGQALSSILSMWIMMIFTIDIGLMYQDALSDEQVESYLIFKQLQKNDKDKRNEDMALEAAYDEIYYEGMKIKSLRENKFSRVYNILEIVRFKIMVIVIIFIQNFGEMQILVVLVIFLSFFITTLYQQIKYGIFESKFIFSIKLLKEIGMLILLLMVFIYANPWLMKLDDLEKITTFESIFLICFCLTMFFEIFTALVIMIKMIVEYFQKRKNIQKKIIPETLSKLH